MLLIVLIEIYKFIMNHHHSYGTNSSNYNNITTREKIGTLIKKFMKLLD
jgi:hypothetical protein